MTRHALTAGPSSQVEPLEPRRLLSISPAPAAAVSPMLIGVISLPTTPVPTSPTPAPQGVTLHETAGVPFTDSVGTFVTIAPASNLRARIAWGDGSATQGTLKSLGIVGVDQIRFEVDGTHTYRRPGTFGIKVTVYRAGPTPLAASSPVKLIAAFKSTAIVAPKLPTRLDGTIKGNYSLAPTAADIGAGYVFNGTGTAGDLGAVSAHAFVTLPGFIATGHATGTMTLTQTGPFANALLNSVTLALTGPAQPGFSSFPGTLAYTITGGTGAFAGATGVGTIAVTINADGTFAFVLTSVLPVAV